MDRKPKKKLGQAAYESLCRKACANPRKPRPNETLEDAYWWSICREVYQYLDIHFSLEPSERASIGHGYRVNLQRLVSDTQTSLLSPIDIAAEYIHRALESEKQKSPNVEPAQACEVHGEVMKVMKVPLIYGTPIMNEAFKKLIEDRARLFPNAHSHFLGGCSLGSRGPAMEALVCAQCREAEKQWAESTGLPTEPDIGGFFIAG
jgi:hypothetical protein